MTIQTLSIKRAINALEKLLAKKCLYLLCIIAALSSLGCGTVLVGRVGSLPKNAIPPVVAVSSMDNRSDFSGQWNLGSGMADVLVSELVSSRNFVVVERRHLETVVSEIDRQKDKRFRNEGKVNDGRLKNARYLIRGVINDFSQISGGSLSLAFRKLFLLGRGHKARVALTLTIVDVESGEIVDSVQCAGTASAREAYAKVKYKGVTFGGDKFFQTPLGIATANAVRRAVTGIVRKMPRVYWEPMVAAIAADGRIILNGGEQRGFRKSDVFRIRGAGKPVTDPVTGDLLDIIPGSEIGVIRVTDVGEKVTYAEILSGSGFRRGQKLLPRRKKR